MDFASYHSGSTSPSRQGRAPLFDEAFANEALLFTESLAAPVDKFFLKFRTGRYRPNHLVTMRNNLDGWEQDIYGAYFEGEWVFFLERLVTCIVWR
jgi:hypothetical protein